MWETLRAAVGLADDARARLTLVKTCASGRAYVWVAPFAVGGAYMSPELDSPEEAARILAEATEQVPDCIPVTTIVLGTDTQESLRKLLRTGNYDAVVAEAPLFSHCWRLRRQIRRDQLMTVTVYRRAGDEAAGNIPAFVTTNRDGALDGTEVTDARGGGRSFGLRPRFSRRLAGAGGEQ